MSSDGDLSTLQLTIVGMAADGSALHRGGRRLATFAVVVCDIRLQGWSVVENKTGTLTIFAPSLIYGPDRRAVVFPDSEWMRRIRDAAISLYREGPAS